jgi:hypothetical protein
MAEQLLALDSLPESAQVEALEGLLELREDLDALDLDLLFAAWRAGDLAALEAIAIPDAHGDPALEAFTDAIYTRRNHIMAERIDALLRGDDRRHFVAIGAAHLVGSEGLPALLEARGWRVRQLEKSSPAAAR